MKISLSSSVLLLTTNNDMCLTTMFVIKKNSMTRDAKLYLLSVKDWKQLAESIDNNSDYTMKNDITIFQLYSPTSKSQDYAILSVSDKADKVIEDYGATLAEEPNLLRNSLHEYYREPLYGDRTNISFLRKVH